MSDNKFQTVDDYIEQFDPDIQVLLNQIRKIIKDNAPDAEETLSWGMPTYKLKGNLLHFSGNKKHIGFYPAPSGVEKFKNELNAYKTSKGAIQFPYNKKLPAALIKKIVKYRRKENLGNL